MSKGAETRARILDEAFRLASREGVCGVTIGTLSTQLGMSKSGLFAHFRSKEELQRQLLARAGERFRQIVLDPLERTEPGLPRLEQLFRRWISWVDASGVPGGCVFLAASTELDDRPGEVRDMLVELQRGLHVRVAKIIRGAIDEGHFRKDVDAEQMTFELVGVVAAYHLSRRLLEDRRAATRARAAFARIVSEARP